MATVLQPKYTRKQIQDSYTAIGAGDREVYQGSPAVVSNVDFVEKNPNAHHTTGSSCHGAKDEYFDPHARKKNNDFKKELLDLFNKYNKDTNKANNMPFFVLTWRHYPHADHPRWNTTPNDYACGCGCGCGCGS